MKVQTKQLTGEIHLIERLKNSVNGNPRYMLCIDNNVFYTRPDSMHAYGITNYTNKKQVVTVTLSEYRGKLCLDSIE